jgi:hypothetical protein
VKPAWWRLGMGRTHGIGENGAPVASASAERSVAAADPAVPAKDESRCPECGDPTTLQASACICESCGWRRFSTAKDAARAEIRCAWCQTVANPNGDGFHLVHVAFGMYQERYCFCSDGCYEAFRKMYPSRVHRNCYERNCRECDLCAKRYEDGVEGWRGLTPERAAEDKERGV